MTTTPLATDQDSTLEVRTYYGVRSMFDGNTILSTSGAFETAAEAYELLDRPALATVWATERERGDVFVIEVKIIQRKTTGMSEVVAHGCKTSNKTTTESVSHIERRVSRNEL